MFMMWSGNKKTLAYQLRYVHCCPVIKCYADKCRLRGSCSDTLLNKFQTGTEPDLVVFFDCPEDLMVKRLLSRNQVGLCTIFGCKLDMIM